MDMLTITQICNEYGVTNRQVQHALDYFKIEPSARIANVRLFDAASVDRIRSAMWRTGALPSKKMRTLTKVKQLKPVAG